MRVCVPAGGGGSWRLGVANHHISGLKRFTGNRWHSGGMEGIHQLAKFRLCLTFSEALESVIGGPQG